MKLVIVLLIGALLMVSATQLRGNNKHPKDHKQKQNKERLLSALLVSKTKEQKPAHSLIGTQDFKSAELDFGSSPQNQGIHPKEQYITIDYAPISLKVFPMTPESAQAVTQVAPTDSSEAVPGDGQAISQILTKEEVQQQTQQQTQVQQQSQVQQQPAQQQPQNDGPYGQQQPQVQQKPQIEQQTQSEVTQTLGQAANIPQVAFNSGTLEEVIQPTGNFELDVKAQEQWDQIQSQYEAEHNLNNNVEQDQFTAESGQFIMSSDAKIQDGPQIVDMNLGAPTTDGSVTTPAYTISAPKVAQTQEVPLEAAPAVEDAPTLEAPTLEAPTLEAPEQVEEKAPKKQSKTLKSKKALKKHSLVHQSLKRNNRKNKSHKQAPKKNSHKQAPKHNGPNHNGPKRHGPAKHNGPKHNVPKHNVPKHNGPRHQPKHNLHNAPKHNFHNIPKHNLHGVKHNMKHNMKHTPNHNLRHGPKNHNVRHAPKHNIQRENQFKRTMKHKNTRNFVQLGQTIDVDMVELNIPTYTGILIEAVDNTITNNLELSAEHEHRHQDVPQSTEQRDLNLFPLLPTEKGYKPEAEVPFKAPEIPIPQQQTPAPQQSTPAPEVKTPVPEVSAPPTLEDNVPVFQAPELPTQSQQTPETSLTSTPFASVENLTDDSIEAEFGFINAPAKEFIPPSIEELENKHFEDSITVANYNHRPDEMAPISEASIKDLKLHHIHNEAKEHLNSEAQLVAPVVSNFLEFEYSLIQVSKEQDAQEVSWPTESQDFDQQMITSSSQVHDANEPQVHAGIVDQTIASLQEPESKAQNSITHVDYNNNMDHADWQTAPQIIEPHVDNQDEVTNSLFDAQAETVQFSGEVEKEINEEVEEVVNQQQDQQGQVEEQNYPAQQPLEEQEQQIQVQPEPALSYSSTVPRENFNAVIEPTIATQDEIFKTLDGADLQYVNYQGEDFIVDPARDNLQLTQPNEELKNE